MVLGAAIAVFSNNLKYILACSSLSQIGFILVGTAALSLLGQHNALAAHGTVLYMMNHSLVKLTLFLLAGVVYCNTHALDLNQIRGYRPGKAPAARSCSCAVPVLWQVFRAFWAISAKPWFMSPW